MSLLLNVIFATHARSTHHKLALDALRHLRGSNTGRWTDTILRHHTAYLEGSKAPDEDFRDFRNHVLHVRENFWGGAVASVHHWYGQLVDHLRGEEWKDAAYAAGVLSHYYSDPLMPFHTGQSETEGAIHRAVEWSVTKSYASLRSMIEDKLGGYPDLEISESADWLGDMVRDGATLANQYYEVIIDHYNLSIAIRNPTAGLDDVAREAIARCLAHATVGFARILERALDESLAAPPEVILTLPALMATINIPYQQIMSRLADSKERKEVEAIFDEVQETGKAIHSLPESERLVRQFHAAEVLRVPLTVLDREKPAPAGTKYTPPPAVKITLAALKQETAVSPAASVTNPQVQPFRTTPPVTRLSADNVQSTNHAPQTEELQSHFAQPASVRVSPGSTLMIDTSTRAPNPVSESGTSATVASEHGETASDSGTILSDALEMSESSMSSYRRFHLRLDAPIVDAPSIGPKTATRFYQLGLNSVSDLIEADADVLAVRLSTRHITPDLLRDWQAQSLLMIDVAGLRGPMAQLLVSAEVRDRASLCSADAESLHHHLLKIAQTSYGRSILRDSPPPALADVERWISEAINTHNANSRAATDSDADQPNVCQLSEA
ncbi:MAG: DUF4332 domain-containing protein [Planctomycetota bacterium]